MLRVYDIKWDTDNDFSTLRLLPSEIAVPENVERLFEENEDAISDYISEQTGFCHFGYKVSYVVDAEVVTNLASRGFSVEQDDAKYVFRKFSVDGKAFIFSVSVCETPKEFAEEIYRCYNAIDDSENAASPKTKNKYFDARESKTFIKEIYDTLTSCA